MRLSLTNKIIVNAAVVIAEIASHPALWQLYNKMLGLYLAKPVDDEAYENTVFCDWKRLVEEVELQTLHEHLRKPY